MNFTPLPLAPVHKCLPSRGQMLVIVTKSLKAELPKALALDRALVDEGASWGLRGDL